MSREVAAVNGRNVLRQKRFESFSVVPVKEVTVQASQLRQRCKRQLLPLNQFECADVTEVTRGVIAEKQQAHVCRRRAMRDDGCWIFLEVIGRQPVVVSADKCFKEAPRAASDNASKRRVFVIQQ